MIRDRFISLLALLAVWWLAAKLVASEQLLPSPGAVLHIVWHETNEGDLLSNVGATLLRVLAAFIVSMSLGSSIGYVTGRSGRANNLIDPWLVIALNLPVLVVVVLVYIWVGLNDVAAVLAVTIAKVPTVIVTVREGARTIDRDLEEMARIHGVGPVRRLGWLAVPQLMPYIAAAGRSGLSITWKIVLIVELLGRPNGVGYALNLFFQNFDVGGILAYGLVFAALMLMIEMLLLQPLERRANAWRRA